MHDRLLSALASLTEVRLVAALRDDRLGFPTRKTCASSSRTSTFITARRHRTGGFRFGTNREELLVEVFTTLKRRGNWL